MNLAQASSGPELADSAHARAVLSIRPAHSCHRKLAWECAFSAENSGAELLSALLGAGYEDDSRCDWLRELRHSAGHTVVFVPRTGRVQIRLHYLTPALERESAASALAAELARLLGATFDET